MIYDSHGGDSTMRERDGQSVQLVRSILTPDADHDAEVLPMYAVRFPDGTVHEVWRDELLCTHDGEEDASTCPLA